MDVLDTTEIPMKTKEAIRTDKRLSEFIDIVSENVSTNWQSLALQLGLTKSDIKRIQRESSNDKQRCWLALMEWKDKTNPLRWTHDLIHALNRCNQRRLADILVKVSSNADDINHLLAPYLRREAQMREAFYTIADHVHKQWRRLASKLGLPPSDLAEVERSGAGRTREKCLNVLYKWRLMVTLNEYKVATLVQLLHACGLNSIADKLQPYASNADLTSPVRRKHKDEVIIHVDVDEIEHQPYGKDSRPYIATKILKEYALNKIFIRFQDKLDAQDERALHPLVDYFHRIHEATIRAVSRRTRSLAIRCASRDRADEIAERTRRGEISEQMTTTLVTTDILEELGLVLLRLRADVYKPSPLTERSEGSETYRSQMEFT